MAQSLRRIQQAACIDRVTFDFRTAFDLASRLLSA